MFDVIYLEKELQLLNTAVDFVLLTSKYSIKFEEFGPTGPT
jgi:hypothetical protein